MALKRTISRRHHERKICPVHVPLLGMVRTLLVCSLRSGASSDGWLLVSSQSPGPLSNLIFFVVAGFVLRANASWWHLPMALGQIGLLGQIQSWLSPNRVWILVSSLLGELQSVHPDLSIRGLGFSLPFSAWTSRSFVNFIATRTLISSLGARFSLCFSSPSSLLLQLQKGISAFVTGSLVEVIRY